MIAPETTRLRDLNVPTHRSKVTYPQLMREPVARLTDEHPGAVKGELT
jgi:hypothetical protein